MIIKLPLLVLMGLLVTSGMGQQQCFVPNCDQCKATDANVCIQCASTFLLADSACICRTNFIAVGSKCVCHVSNATTTCASCSIPNCLACGSSNLCVTCLAGLIPSTGGKSCILDCGIPNCLSCISSTACGICKIGYSVSFFGTCLQCPNDNCVSCSDNNICRICNNGFLLIGNECVLCKAPCNLCSKNGTCLQCTQPYSRNIIPQGQVCYQCTVAGCDSCEQSDPSSCLRCFSPHYRLVNKTCVRACSASNCLVCVADICTICLPTYTLNASQCLRCTNAPVCIACASANVQLCTQCVSSYYLNTTTNLCVPCPSYCRQCTSAGCTSLLNLGRVLINYYGVPSLASCNSNCLQCSSVDPSICSVCNDGFALRGPNCIPCLGNCAECNPANLQQCTECFIGYYIHVNGTASVCLSCNRTSKCLSCLSSNISMCTSCLEGSFVDGTGMCVPNCPFNCMTCTSEKICTLCAPRFTVSNGLCVPCLLGCVYCSSPVSICLDCGPSEYLNTRITPATCNPCPTNCIYCYDSGCVRCAINYYITSSGCAPVCQSPCATCSNLNPSTCLTCLVGYVLNGVMCTPDQNCDHFGPNECVVCPFGSVLDGNRKCISCSSGCARCQPTTPNICTSCYDGQYLNGNQMCESCSPSCEQCINADMCLSCKIGYVSSFISGAVKCIACAARCRSCLGSIDFCFSCAQGYSLLGNQCVSSFNFYFTITLNTDLPTFNINYQSFIITLSQVTGTKDGALLTSLTTGSVYVQGYLSTTASPATDSSKQQYNNLATLLTAGSSIAGISIISSTVGTNGGTAFPDQTDIGIILGICIPLLVLIIVGIAVFIYCRKKKSKELTADLKYDQDSIEEKFEINKKSEKKENSDME